ncbi:hypothetical protein E4U41_001400 [Claviceps citrina]|nr:hypothetical protein E4U41_001400 [Claviceps citrina]
MPLAGHPVLPSRQVQPVRSLSDGHMPLQKAYRRLFPSEANFANKPGKRPLSSHLAHHCRDARWQALLVLEVAAPQCDLGGARAEYGSGM